MHEDEGNDMRAADPEDNTNGGYVAPNNKDGSGQTETDELDAIAINLLTGKYPDVKDFKADVQRYSHHQTEQVLVGLLEKQQEYVPVGYGADRTRDAVPVRAIELELERLKEQSLPTNKDKERAMTIEELAQEKLGDKWEDFKEYVDGIEDWDMTDVERYLNR